MEWIGIVGTRDFPVPAKVKSYVAALPTGVGIVSGGGGIVDNFAEMAAKAEKRPYCVFPAHWGRHGNAAGPIRNRQIGEFLATMGGRLVAFHDGKSRGTAGMIAIAQELGVPVEVVGPPDHSAAPLPLSENDFGDDLRRGEKTP